MPASVLVAPSILSADFARLAEEIRAVEAAGADLVHVDVMDGRFVPNLTIGPPVVAALRKVTRLPLDCHLMVVEPERLVPAFLDAGADCVTFQIEATHHPQRLLAMIRAAGRKAGVAVNPATGLEFLDYLGTDLDRLLVMTVNPGFGGQAYLPAMTAKIARAREALERSGSAADIEVDGGITDRTAPSAVAAGAAVLVAGNHVFAAADRAAAIAALKGAPRP